MRLAALQMPSVVADVDANLACIEEGLYYPEVSPTLGVVKAWVECIIPFSFVLVSWRIVEEYVVRWRNGTLGELVRYEEAA